MSKERFVLFSAAHLLLMDGNKVLLSQRFNTGYRDGQYSVPAGHLEGGETVTECIIREAKEEIGIDLAKTDVEMAHITHNKDGRETASFFLMARTWSGEVTNMEPDKCSDLQWFSVNALPENTIPYVRHAIECAMKSQFYSEFGWD